MVTSRATADKLLMVLECELDIANTRMQDSDLMFPFSYPKENHCGAHMYNITVKI